jgi:hypothetical protein
MTKMVKIIILLLLILLFLSILPVLLFGKAQPQTLAERDILPSIFNASGLTWNGSSLEVVNFKFQSTAEGVEVIYEKPVTYAFLFLSPTILNDNPEYFLIKLIVNGNAEFIYGIRVIKVLDASSSPDYEVGPTVLFKSMGKQNDEYDAVRLDTYNLNTVNRKEVPPNDLLQFFVSNKRSEQTNVNQITRIRILEIRAVYSKEPLTTSGSINDNILQVSLFVYFVLVFIVPLVGIMLISKKTFFNLKTVILIGLLPRILVAPFTGHAYDMELWTYANRMFYENGKITLFYSWTPPPLFYFIEIAFYAPYVLLHYYAKVPDFRPIYLPFRGIEALFMKLPMIIADTVIFIILFRYLSELTNDDLTESKRKRALLWSSMFFLNPCIIFISSVWGQYDTVSLAFLVAGLYLLKKEKYVLSYILLSASFLTKWIGLAPILLLFISQVVLKQWRRVIKLIITVITTITISWILPFAIVKQESFLREVLLYRIDQGSNIITWNGLSYLQYLRVSGLMDKIPEWILDNHFFITGMFFFLVIMYGFFKDLKKSDDKDKSSPFILIRWTVAIFLAFYLSYPEIHEPHVIWIIPLIILLMSNYNPEKILVGGLIIPSLAIFAILSAFSGQSLIYMITGFVMSTFSLQPNAYAYQASVSLIFSSLVLTTFYKFSGISILFSKIIIKERIKLNIQGNFGFALLASFFIVSLYLITRLLLAEILFLTSPELHIVIFAITMLIMPVYLSSILTRVQICDNNLILYLL